MKRKLFALTLVFVMLISPVALVGCDEKPATPEDNIDPDGETSNPGDTSSPEDDEEPVISGKFEDLSVLDYEGAELLPVAVKAENFEKIILLPLIEKFQELLFASKDFVGDPELQAQYDFLGSETIEVDGEEMPTRTTSGYINIETLNEYMASTDVQAYTYFSNNKDLQELKKALGSGFVGGAENYNLMDPVALIKEYNANKGSGASNQTVIRKLSQMFKNFPITGSWEGSVDEYGQPTDKNAAPIAGTAIYALGKLTLEVDKPLTAANFYTLLMKYTTYTPKSFNIDDSMIPDVNTLTDVENPTNGMVYMPVNGGKAYQLIGIGTATSETEINIPAIYNNLPVISIGVMAFRNCDNITNITIPNSIIHIGRGAFSGCSNLNNIVIPSGVTSIGDSAFSGCTSLASITIPGSVTSIGNSAFSGCTSLTSITIPNTITSIGNSAFRDCTSLTSITIPDSVTSIGDYAFRGCTRLTSITLPDSVTSIGNSAFCYCKSLTSITLLDSVTSISDYAFHGCMSLTSITIPDSVTSISDSAFRGCTSLTSITIPNNITIIDYNTFAGCTSLSSVVIPNSVTSIMSDAFDDCVSLSDVYFTGTEKEWQAVTIQSDNNTYFTNATIHYNYVPEG